MFQQGFSAKSQTELIVFELPDLTMSKKKVETPPIVDKNASKNKKWKKIPLGNLGIEGNSYM